jgi:hypothetical protein
MTPYGIWRSFAKPFGDRTVLTTLTRCGKIAWLIGRRSTSLDCPAAAKC